MIVGELYKIEAFDGLVYFLTDGESRFVVSTIDSAGLPPYELLTRRPYKADRLIETGFRLNARSFSIDYQFVQKCSRDQYWDARSELLNALRPNRGGALTVTLILADGTKRAIQARAFTPVFPSVPVDEINEWNFAEVLQFTANDPTFFNPAQSSNSVVNAPATELAFPITFDDNNIYFGAGSSYGSVAINYIGTWYSYPLITITPPYNSVRVHHDELNVSLEVLYGSSTQDMIINLDAGTIIRSDGTSLFNYLTSDSDLQGFRLEPDPIVANGINTLIFTIPGANNPATTVQIDYNERYIGI